MNNELNSQTLRGSRWLITGGCGFLGTSLIKRLVSEGVQQIRVLDNLTVGTRKDLAKVCTFTEENLTQEMQFTSSPGSQVQLIGLVISGTQKYA